MFHVIYKTTCSITGRFYVGMHSTKNLEDGYLGSGKLLRYSVNKHGESCHQREILATASSRSELCALEKELVTKALIDDPLCMNLKVGGDGGWDHMNSNSDIQRLRSVKGLMKMRELWSDPEWAAQMRSKMPLPTCSWVGRTHREETKNKIGAANSKYTGENSKNTGSKWVTNGTPMRVKADRVDELLARGYILGRKYPDSV